MRHAIEQLAAATANQLDEAIEQLSVETAENIAIAVQRVANERNRAIRFAVDALRWEMRRQAAETELLVDGAIDDAVSCLNYSYVHICIHSAHISCRYYTRVYLRSQL